MVFVFIAFLVCFARIEMLPRTMHLFFINIKKNLWGFSELFF